MHQVEGRGPGPIHWSRLPGSPAGPRSWSRARSTACTWSTVCPRAVSGPRAGRSSLSVVIARPASAVERPTQIDGVHLVDPALMQHQLRSVARQACGGSQRDRGPGSHQLEPAGAGGVRISPVDKLLLPIRTCVTTSAARFSTDVRQYPAGPRLQHRPPEKRSAASTAVFPGWIFRTRSSTGLGRDHLFLSLNLMIDRIQRGRYSHHNHHDPDPRRPVTARIYLDRSQAAQLSSCPPTSTVAPGYQESAPNIRKFFSQFLILRTAIRREPSISAMNNGCHRLILLRLGRGKFHVSRQRPVSPSISVSICFSPGACFLIAGAESVRAIDAAESRLSKYHFFHL